MIPVHEAWHAILAHARPTGTVRLPLGNALGRVLRTAARADADSPPFDAAAMDGYALRRTDAGRALRVIGAAEAGSAFTGILGAGECVRILTGAPVPAGADCVVKQEDVVRTGDSVQVLRHDGPDFIRRSGENRRRGDIVVPAGTRLGPPELAALAAAGIGEPEVARAPRCAHLVTGNELVPPDRTPTGAQIRDSNSTLIAALLTRLGNELVGQTRVRDDLAAAQAAVAALPAHDVLLISGGASVGDLDIARPLLEALGYTLHFHALNLRPGKPLVFASRGAQLAFVLPGNPVSHWVVFQLFIAPLLDYLQTGAGAAPARLTGRLAEGRVPPPDTRQTFWPCRAVITQGGYDLTPLPLASSGDSAGLVGANALLPVPPPPGSFATGQFVEFIPCP
ncbi:MAG: molybdopterin molybdotransferase MoeA [Opitutae bacterium]|nr:molybdopterin molybdotransferase MoeA [Opitutae bacterium]